MSEDDGPVCAYRLDGNGGGQALDWPGIEAAAGGGGVLWVHLDRGNAQVRSWLRNESGVDGLVCEALLAQETGPRCDAFGDGRLLVLRGVNLNPGAEPEDMVALRLWVEPGRVISLRRRRVKAADDLRVAIGEGRGPTDVAGMVAFLAARLVERSGPFLDELEDGIGALEEQVLMGESRTLRGRLHELRQTAITLRRYVAPQRQAMASLLDEAPDWLDRARRAHLRETAGRITRYVEDLDAARERAAVVQDELATRLSEQLNRRMFLLSVVAGVFLPLSFVTGLLGMNTAGMPGTEDPFAFALICGGLLLLGGFEIWLFKRLSWL